jgi:hypothetical protein
VNSSAFCGSNKVARSELVTVLQDMKRWRFATAFMRPAYRTAGSCGVGIYKLATSERLHLANGNRVFKCVPMIVAAK